MPRQDAFNLRRAQSLCRLASYVLLAEYLLGLLFAGLPPSLAPERWLGLITMLQDTASLLVLACLLFFSGMLNAFRPARWEWRLARAARPLLALTALLFLLMVPGILGLGARIWSSTDGALRQQSSQLMAQLTEVRHQLTSAPDSATLRRLIQQQPLLQPSLTTAESPFFDTGDALSLQKSRASVLLDRIAENITLDSQRRRANASGELRKQQARLIAMSLLHATFFLMAWLVWPNGLSVQPPQALAADREPVDADDV